MFQLGNFTVLTSPKAVVIHGIQAISPTWLEPNAALQVHALLPGKLDTVPLKVVASALNIR